MESIKVSLRVRPLHVHERDQKQDLLWKITDERHLQVDKSQLAKIIKSNQILPNKLSQYEFQQCFSPQSTNFDIFQLFTRDVVLTSLQGINGTVFLYGQTGAGKTFTMLGGCHTHLFKEGNVQAYIKQALTEKRFNDLGVLIYSLMELFKQINKDQENFYHLKCSYYEIYNENVFDLLQRNHNEYSQPLQINMSSKTQEFELRGLTEQSVTSLEQVIELIRKGERNRHYAETILNHHSSRSHTIFKLQIQIFKEKSQPLQQDSYLKSHLVFVDLAGSERISQQPREEDIIRQFYGLDDPQVEIRANQRERARESQMINKSLFYLTRIIAMKVRKQNVHIPYRNSTLTKLLKGSLSGNSKTVLILCINPTINHLDQSLQTIKFGENAKLIENKVDINLVEFKNQQKSLEGLKEIKDLRRRISEMEDAYRKQQTQLQNVQKQLQSTLKDKEQLLTEIKKDRIQTTEGQEQYMNLCANHFLQSHSTTASTQSNLDQLNQIVQDYEGSIIVERYRDLLGQLQAQQVKNKLLEDECQRLHRKIVKHDVLLDSFQRGEKMPRERRSHPEPIPEDPKPDLDLTPIRRRNINASSYQLQNSAESVGVNRSQDSEFEKQIKLIIQAWDSQKTDGMSELFKTDESDSGAKRVLQPQQQARTSPFTLRKTSKPIPRPKSSQKKSAPLPVPTKKGRSLSSDSQRQPSPRPQGQVRALSSKKRNEMGRGVEITSFAEKLLHLTTQIELKKQQQSRRVVKKPSVPQQQQRRMPKPSPISYEVHKKQQQQVQQQPKPSALSKFNVHDVIFETESELADEYSRGSVQ